jgi:hypothetical protein
MHGLWALGPVHTVTVRGDKPSHKDDSIVVLVLRDDSTVILVLGARISPLSPPVRNKISLSRKYHRTVIKIENLITALEERHHHDTLSESNPNPWYLW